jgi:exosortase/archaeosortase family protein
MMGNILRVSLTGAMVLVFGLETAEGFFHQFSGLVVFIFTIVTLMIFSAFLKGASGADETD